jgi:hypothetical protein
MVFMSVPSSSATSSSQRESVAQSSFSTNPSAVAPLRRGLNLRPFPTDCSSPVKLSHTSSEKSGPLSLNLTAFFHQHQKAPAAPGGPLFPSSETPSPSTLDVHSLRIFSPEPASSRSDVSTPISASPSATPSAGLERSASGPESLGSGPIVAKTKLISAISQQRFPIPGASTGLSPLPLTGSTRSASGPAIPPPSDLSFSRPQMTRTSLRFSEAPVPSRPGSLPLSGLERAASGPVMPFPRFTPMPSPRSFISTREEPQSFPVAPLPAGLEDLSPPQLGRVASGGPAIPSESQDKFVPLALQSGFVSPSAVGFNESHSELRIARGGLLSPPSLTHTPATPQVRKNSIQKKYENSAFIQNARTTLKLIREKLKEKAEKQKELGGKACFEPFNLEIAPGISRRITDIKPLISSGRHAQVYRCEVEGEGSWVIKLYQDEILDNPLQAVRCAASQLFRYAQNRTNLALNQHIVPHANFEPHLKPVINFLSENQFDRTESFKKYILQNVKQGFLFCPYIENEFPLEFDAENSAWIQLKDLFQESFKAGIINDLRRSNVRTVINKTDKGDEIKVWLIDLMEVDADEDEFSPYVPELIRTFTDQEEQQKWLSPSLELP